ncbi:unnamed protein product [Arctogadus glacialis]
MCADLSLESCLTPRVYRLAFFILSHPTLCLQTCLTHPASHHPMSADLLEAFCLTPLHVCRLAVGILSHTTLCLKTCWRHSVSHHPMSEDLLEAFCLTPPYV